MEIYLLDEDLLEQDLIACLAILELLVFDAHNDETLKLFHSFVNLVYYFQQGWHSFQHQLIVLLNLVSQDSQLGDRMLVGYVDERHDLRNHLFHYLDLLEASNVQVANVDYIIHHEVFFDPQLLRGVLVDVPVAKKDHEQL